GVRARITASPNIWKRNTTALANCRSKQAMMEVIERLESRVRGYVRSFPCVFATAHGNRMTDIDGNDYLDFFSGAGALSFGHNDPVMERALLDYISGGGVNHGLDMATAAQ